MNRNSAWKVFFQITFISLMSFSALAGNYYEVLELPKGMMSSQDEIKRAYRRLAMRYHPDRNPGNKAAEEKFKELNNANEVLSDLVRRKRYDQGLPDISVSENVEKSGRRRTEFGYEVDPEGVIKQNNERINFLNESYVEMRKTKSTAESLIATMKRERGIRRKHIYGAEIYEGQTQYVFREFMREIMDDLFYSGESINSPDDRPIAEIQGERNALVVAPKFEITFSRWPTLDQLMEINRLFGGRGNYDMIERALKEARSRTDLVELFHYKMKMYIFDLLDHPINEDFFWISKKLVTGLLPPLRRLYSNENVPEFIAEFILSRLYRFNPTDRKMLRHLLAILKSIATPEAIKVLQDLSTHPRANAFVRAQAKETLNAPSMSRNTKENVGHAADNAASGKSPVAKISLDNATIQSLKKLLAEPVASPHGPGPVNWIDRLKKIDDQFEAATRLFDAEKLDSLDILHLGMAVDKYYWRYASYAKGESVKIIHTIMKLVPSHPEVIPMLARATEQGWGHPAEEIAVMAMEQEIRHPILLEAFRQYVSSGIEDRFEYQKVLEALGRLGDVKNQALIETLQRKATFKYINREPSPEAYEAALALGRLGARDPETVNLLRSLMRKNEGLIFGSGVPFAAALKLMGITDSEVMGLLNRELTHSPNGFRQHTEVANEALETKPSSQLICEKLY